MPVKGQFSSRAPPSWPILHPLASLRAWAGQGGAFSVLARAKPADTCLLLIVEGGQIIKLGSSGSGALEGREGVMVQKFVANGEDITELFIGIPIRAGVEAVRPRFSLCTYWLTKPRR